MRALFVSTNGSSAHRLRAESPESTVDVSTSLATACSVLAERKYDAVLSDLDMPDGSAFTLLAHLRQVHPATPMIVVADDDHLRFATLEAGADDYVVRSPQLGRSLVAAVRAARARRDQEHAATLQTCLRVLYIGRDTRLRQLLEATPAVHLTVSPPEFEVAVSATECHVAIVDARSLNAVHQVRKLREVAPSLPLVLMAEPGDYEVSGRSLPLGVEEVILRSANYEEQIVHRLRRVAALGRHDSAAPDGAATEAETEQEHESPAEELAVDDGELPVDGLLAAANEPHVDALPAEDDQPPLEVTAEDNRTLMPEPEQVSSAVMAPDLVSTDSAPAAVSAEDDNMNPPFEPPDMPQPSPTRLNQPVVEDSRAVDPVPADAAPQVAPPVAPPVRLEGSRDHLTPSSQAGAMSWTTGPADPAWLRSYVDIQRRARQAQIAGDVVREIESLLDAAIAEHPRDQVLKRVRAVAGDFLAFSGAQAAARDARHLDEELASIESMLRLMVGSSTELVIATGGADARVLMGRDDLIRLLTSLAIAGRDSLPVGGRLTIRTERALVGASAGNAMPPGTLLHVIRIHVEAQGHIPRPFDTPVAVRDLVVSAGGECQPAYAAEAVSGVTVSLPIVVDSPT